MPPFFGQDFMQQTPAAQHVMRQTLGKGARRVKRVKRKAKKIAKTARRAKRKAKRAGKLVKGSAAAKRYMASIRRKRR